MPHPRQVTGMLVHWFVMLAETALLLRVLFSLFNADVSKSFVRWVYETTETLLMPFVEWFPPESFESTYVLEFRVLFAMAAWAVVGYVALAVVHWLPKPPVERMDWSKLTKMGR